MKLSLGENICLKRKEKGFTQEELAGKMNVSRQAVSDWERNVKMPELSNLIDLAKLLDASLDWMLSDELSRDGENNNKADSDGRTLKIVPALQQFAEKVAIITENMYMEEKE